MYLTKDFISPFSLHKLLKALKGLQLTTLSFFIGITFLFYTSVCSAYEVEFKGIEDPKILETIKSVSQLEKLKDTPPATASGLQRRAISDIENIIHALHSLAYYNAKVDYEIVNEGAAVLVKIVPGPQYPLAEFTIRYFHGDAEIMPEGGAISLKDLKVIIGDPALPETIITAEDIILDQLNLRGYAYPTIRKREAVADQSKNVILVYVEVETGPLTYFGPLKISGLSRVKEGFIYKKLRWQEGDLYDPHKLEKTQEALEMAGLFRSINFNQGTEPLDGNLVPIDLNVLEGKQRSIGYGLNYTTQLGPGITGEWEDRNMFGLGEKLSIRGDIWAKMQVGAFTYLIPDYKIQNQNLIYQIDYEHEHTKAFTEKSLSLSATIERKWSEQLRFSYGLMYKLLRSTRSENNGTFDLIKTPLQFRWSNTDSLLDPTSGVSVLMRIIPSFQILAPRFVYSINSLTTSFYMPLTADKRHVFASKIMLGSIFGSSEHTIPPPERFYAGSENALRGYRFLTVSPIERRHHKPIGGRSLFVYSLELRSRIGENFGLVTFYEIGNVCASYYPNIEKNLLQSAGVGLRYHTPVGPLRLDVAFPLNRRKHIDSLFEVYFSIGQSF